MVYELKKFAHGSKLFLCRSSQHAPEADCSGFEAALPTACASQSRTRIQSQDPSHLKKGFT